MQKKYNTIDSKSTGIFLFLKYPTKGKVKSRLSKEIGETKSIHFYKFFVADILSTIKGLNQPTFICYSPKNSKDKFRKWLGENYFFIEANGETFGQKLKNCFYNAFNQGFNQVIIIAGDNPDLPQKYIIEAISFLDSNDAVIGPCEDGGYYLIGFTKTGFLPNVFDGIRWSSPDVLQTTLDILKRKKLKIHILPKWYDIDTYEDILKFYNRNKNSPFNSLKTMNYLKKYLKNKTDYENIKKEIVSTKKNVISVIIPIIRISKDLSIVRDHVKQAKTPIEIILVIDSSVKETIPLSPCERVVKVSKRGRGNALAEGIRNSSGDIIIFVHSDTLLPENWDKAVINALEDKEVIGGGFSHTFDTNNSYLYFTSSRPSIRLNLFHELWGEQAMFVRAQFIKKHISEIEIPIMEDVELSRLMNKNGKVVILGEKVITSASAFIENGIIRNIFRVLKARLWYEVGGDPEKIYDFYYNK